MIFCVFSFNRGRFLENCIHSIERCVPNSRIVIFDDDSDDPNTIGVLGKFSEKHALIQPGHQSNHHLGGLYGNMQSALEYCREEETVCFLQDDTQVVRPLLEEDFSEIEGAFRHFPQLGFISPCFIRKRSLLRGASYRYDEQSGLFFRDPDKRSAGRFFSALLIMKPQRLLEHNWEFGGSEPENNRRASLTFMPMGYLPSPFAMWLPEVPAYRGKNKTLGLKLAEKKRNCGFYPFSIMSETQTEALKNRSMEDLPVAEDFLACSPIDPPKPWAYNPLTNTGWIKILNQIEVRFRRFLKR